MSADLVSRIPELRAFAISLCRSADQSDDLVQDTLLSAWANLDHFKEGTNLGAWLTTILRNRFVNLYRRQRSRGEVVGTALIESLPAVPAQDGWEIATDLGDALDQLPRHQRQAVLLVGADGLSLAEAAVACDCEVGTIKSRVSRARAHLTTLMADNGPAAPRASRRRSPRERLKPRESSVPLRLHAGAHSRPLHATAAARN
jgi:RNA polymerase sigma-70 factor (ECF subfamily)